MGAPSAGSWFGEYTSRTTGPGAKELAAIFESELAEIDGFQLPMAYEPMVVPLTSYQSLLDATKRLLELQRRAVMELAPDPAGRVAALGADPADYPRFTADGAFEMEHAIDMARPDVVIGEDGPKFVEFNLGAGVGGVLEFELERRIWERIRRDNGEPVYTSSDVYRLLADLIKRNATAYGLPPEALLIGSLADPDKTLSYFNVQIKLLEEFGVRARFADLTSLEEELARGPNDVLGLVQFSESEGNAGGWDMSSLASAVAADGLVAIPSQTAGLIDLKKVLALVSEGFAWMSAQDRELVRRFVPWTRIVGDRRVAWRGGTYELPRLLLDRQRLFVLKGSAGHASQEVFFGANTSEREWQRLVESAVESEYYVAQEVVTPLRHPIQVLLDEDGTVDTFLAGTRLCPFFVGGVPTGCLMRFHPTGRIGPMTRPYGAWPGCLLGAPA